MEDHELKCRIVSRMWRDGITVDRQWADVATVARLAVGSSDEGRAKALLTDEMEANPECPVLKTGAGMVALKKDKAAVAEYLRRHCEESDIPWGLR